MICLVIGTKDSGKSALAEDLAMTTGDMYRIYLATMKVYDAAGQERVEKHRKQRAGKGFETVELFYSISEIDKYIQKAGDTTVLLECVSNLVGNEIYENPDRKGFLLKARDDTDRDIRKAELAAEIAEEIRSLAQKVHNLIIVTNDYEAGSDNYDEETKLYVQLLNMVNERMIKFSDKIYDLRKGKTD